MRRHTFLFAGLVLAATLVLISDSRLLVAQQSSTAPPKEAATQKTQITRDDEFVEEGGGKDYAKQNNRQVSMTYRLGMESILDLPNKFVGPKKCGECHPA